MFFFLNDRLVFHHNTYKKLPTDSVSKTKLDQRIKVKPLPVLSNTSSEEGFNEFTQMKEVLKSVTEEQRDQIMPQLYYTNQPDMMRPKDHLTEECPKSGPITAELLMHQYKISDQNIAQFCVKQLEFYGISNLSFVHDNNIFLNKLEIITAFYHVKHSDNPELVSKSIEKILTSGNCNINSKMLCNPFLRESYKDFLQKHENLSVLIESTSFNNLYSKIQLFFDLNHFQESDNKDTNEQLRLSNKINSFFQIKIHPDDLSQINTKECKDASSFEESLSDVSATLCDKYEQDLQQATANNITFDMLNKAVFYSTLYDFLSKKYMPYYRKAISNVPAEKRNLTTVASCLSIANNIAAVMEHGSFNQILSNVGITEEDNQYTELLSIQNQCLSDLKRAVPINTKEISNVINETLELNNSIDNLVASHDQNVASAIQPKVDYNPYLQAVHKKVQSQNTDLAQPVKELDRSPEDNILTFDILVTHLESSAGINPKNIAAYNTYLQKQKYNFFQLKPEVCRNIIQRVNAIEKVDRRNKTKAAKIANVKAKNVPKKVIQDSASASDETEVNPEITIALQKIINNPFNISLNDLSIIMAGKGFNPKLLPKYGKRIAKMTANGSVPTQKDIINIVKKVNDNG